MSDRSTVPGWLSEQTGLAAIALVSVALAMLTILPYLQYILLGVVLAYILMPAQRRLENVVGSMVAAFTLVVVAVLAILVPTIYIVAIAVGQALDVATAVQDGSLEVADVEQWFADAGYEIDIEQAYESYQEPIATGLQGVASNVLEIVGSVPAMLIGLTVTLFVLFALLRDGDRLVAWFRYVLPVDDDLQRELIAELDQLMWASVVGNVAVAAIQAVLLGVGLAVLGLPAVIFLTVATFVLALLPLVGAFGVWVPVSVYLVAVGEPITALILVVYGSLVSASDTYLRPALIGRTSAFNSAIIVVGIFGGLVAFGAVGLFIGPVVLGGAKVTLDAFARERDRSTRATEDEPLPADDPAAETAGGTGPATDADPDAVTESDDGAEADEGANADETEEADPTRSADSGGDPATDSDPDPVS